MISFFYITTKKKKADFPPRKFLGRSEIFMEEENDQDIINNVAGIVGVLGETSERSNGRGTFGEDAHDKMIKCIIGLEFYYLSGSKMSGSTDDFPDKCCEKYCSYNSEKMQQTFRVWVSYYSKKQKLSFNSSITDVICRIVQIYRIIYQIYRSATPNRNKDHSQNIGDNLRVAE